MSSFNTIRQSSPTKKNVKTNNKQQTRILEKQSQNATYKIVHTNMQLKYAIFFGYLKKIVF